MTVLESRCDVEVDSPNLKDEIEKWHNHASKFRNPNVYFNIQQIGKDNLRIGVFAVDSDIVEMDRYTIK